MYRLLEYSDSRFIGTIAGVVWIQLRCYALRGKDALYLQVI